MGSSMSSSAGRTLTRAAGNANAALPARKMEVPTASEIAAINRLVEQDQARLRQLPSFEELGQKDEPLDQLLARMGTSVVPKDLALGDQPKHTMPPAFDPRSAAQAAAAERSAGAPAGPGPGSSAAVGLDAGAAALGAARRQKYDAEDVGRVQSYVLREIFEQRNALGEEAFLRELEHHVRLHKIDRAKLALLLQYTCLPDVGKVATFGHQYAFARTPRWFKRGAGGADSGSGSGERFLSEPESFMSSPTPPPAPPAAAAAAVAAAATATAATPESAVQHAVKRAASPPAAAAAGAKPDK